MGMQHFGKRLARQPIVDKPPTLLLHRLIGTSWFGSGSGVYGNRQHIFWIDTKKNRCIGQKAEYL